MSVSSPPLPTTGRITKIQSQNKRNIHIYRKRLHTVCALIEVVLRGELPKVHDEGRSVRGAARRVQPNDVFVELRDRIVVLDGGAAIGMEC